MPLRTARESSPEHLLRLGLQERGFLSFQIWSGPAQNGSAAYFRIQGPKLVIEYAPQGMGGDPTLHIHTIYRDPTNDYGKKAAEALSEIV